MSVLAKIYLNHLISKLKKSNFPLPLNSKNKACFPLILIRLELKLVQSLDEFIAILPISLPSNPSFIINSPLADPLTFTGVLEDAEANTAETLKPILAEIKGQEARLAVLHQEQNKKKPEEITQQEKDDVHNTEKAISDEKAKRNEIISGYAKNNNIVHQLIDLALLQNGMLKGASLDAFLKRSVDMIK